MIAKVRYAPLALSLWLYASASLSAQNAPQIFLPARADRAVLNTSKASLTKNAVKSNAVKSNAVAGCPDQGGLLDSITVPVGQPLDLGVELASPAPPGGATFQLSSDNPAFVAAGDVHQGFLPIVTVPAGGTESNLFTLYGIAVGQTLLRLTPQSPGFAATSFPLGAWDVNKSGAGSDQKFLDANDPVQACRDANSGAFSANGTLLSTCGKVVKGVASDGLNALLLRTISGLAGTACFEIVSSSPLDQGTVKTPLTNTQPINSLNYGFSYLTPPSSYGDASDSRTITVEFSFTPNIGNGNTSTLQATTTIVRPPVMLLHGLWSGAGTWSSNFLRNDATHTTFAGDYGGTSASSFSSNQTRAKDGVAQVLNNFRGKGFAATQADVIGHSMGGLLTRLYAGSATYQRPENLNMGDIHRLVTLDTPHFGSSFANLLVALHRANPAKTESTVVALVKGSVVNGAVCDLAENSPALQALGATTLKSQVITATGGPAGSPANPAPYWGGATFMNLNSFESALTETYCTNWSVDSNGTPKCLAMAPYFPTATVDAFRFLQQNDAVVPLSSQAGGIAGLNFPAYVHFHIPGIPGVQRGVTDGADVAAQTFQILDGPDSALVAGLPAVQSNGSGAPLTVPGRGAPNDQNDYSNQCGAGGPLKMNAVPGMTSFVTDQVSSAAPLISIVSPSAGASFKQGDTLTITIALSPPLTVANSVGVAISGLKHFAATWTTGLQFQTTLVIPATLIGPLQLTPDFTDTLGNITFGAPIVVGVQPATNPLSVTMQQKNYFVSSTVAPQQLYLSGAFPDGSTQDLTSPQSGTTWSTSNSSVAAVSGTGLVTINGAGFVNVTATNSGLSDFATFFVSSSTNPLPPVNQTAQVTINGSGFRLDRTNGFFLQNVTITNNSGAPLPGALYLVLSNLTAGVTLVNKSGLTQAIAPVGSSYLVLSLPGEGVVMPPGGTVQFTLQFLNANRSAISYSTNLFSTSVAP